MYLEGKGSSINTNVKQFLTYSVAFGAKNEIFMCWKQEGKLHTQPLHGAHTQQLSALSIFWRNEYAHIH